LLIPATKVIAWSDSKPKKKNGKQNQRPITHARTQVEEERTQRLQNHRSTLNHQTREKKKRSSGGGKREKGLKTSKRAQGEGADVEGKGRRWLFQLSTGRSSQWVGRKNPLVGEKGRGEKKREDGLFVS